MDKQNITELREENSRLKTLANHDELTGIYNRRAIERIVSGSMERGGALLVCDLDRFKHINDTYGHLVGDHCLKRTAELLGYIIRQSDVLGRFGGDEFIIFAYGIQDENGIAALSRKIQSRFVDQNRREEIQLSLTIGGAIYKPGDTYASLFDRADQVLLQLKEEKRRTGEYEIQSPDFWVKDMSEIQAELSEEIKNYGAMAQDYEAFKSIYRFIERTMRRNKQEACLALISLTDAEGGNLMPLEKSARMVVLGHVLQSFLRLGDVFTRYSSCQYLVLLIDANLPQAEMVCERIKEKYLSKAKGEDVFLHYCARLGTAKLPEE